MAKYKVIYDGGAFIDGIYHDDWTLEECIEEALGILSEWESEFWTQNEIEERYWSKEEIIDEYENYKDESRVWIETIDDDLDEEIDENWYTVWFPTDEEFESTGFRELTIEDLDWYKQNETEGQDDNG